MTHLTVRQVAQRLQVSAQVVYQLCAGRKLAHTRIGLGRGTIRITEAALEELLERCAVRQFVDEHGLQTPGLTLQEGA